MKKNVSNDVPLQLWQRGMDSLKALDVGFVAFYGAEPLLEFPKLPSIIGYCENNKIYTTVITSGIVPDFYLKLNELYDHGCRSLSMSYDMMPLDAHSKAKGIKALEGIEYFNSLGPNRDTALISTLTRTNVNLVAETLEFIEEELGSWFFFDIIHSDRGQPGSKCKGDSPDLLFKTKKDFENLYKTLIELLTMKKKGYKCHTSELFINTISANDFEVLKKYNWNCADNDELFPSWVTVDNDGQVYPCDDFQPIITDKFYVWELKDRWNEFVETWKPIVKKQCPGCVWNSHIDAHLIKAGQIPFSNYVHTNRGM